MSIWFYLSLLSTLTAFLLLIKIISMKKEIKNIEKSIDRILNCDTNSLITVISNDTDLKKLATYLNLSLKRLRKLEIEYSRGNLELKNSITNISHDLRTPLTAIRGYLDLFDPKNLTKKQKDYLTFIRKKTDDLTKLTEQLFAYSKTLESSVFVKKEKICLIDILEDVVASSYSLFKENDLEPSVAMPNKKIYKNLDENALKRVLENVIYNAIKYSENEVAITLNDEGLITVSNTTTKLTHTSVEKIFDRYFTVENAKKSAGIGLSIAKQLVELNGGQISAKLKDNHLVVTLEF